MTGAEPVEGDDFSCLPQRKPKRPRSMRWKAYVATWFVKVLARMLRFILRLDVKTYNRGSVPKGMPVLCVGNHLSFADPPFWGATISRNGAILAAEELRKMRYVGFFLRMLFRIRGDILVARGSDEGGQDALEKVDNVLANGGLVGGYPEGGIKRDRWHKGLFSLTLKHQAAIVVIRVDGTDDFWASTKADIAARGGRVFNRKAKLRIRYSDPLYYDDYKHMTDIELAQYCHNECDKLAA